MQSAKTSISGASCRPVSGALRRRRSVFCCTGAIRHRERKQFFCQREAIETLIWLTEVAPKKFSEDIKNANAEANPGLYRLACKMATGAGKTTVMAMIIAWQAVNKARRPNAKNFSDAFLIVTPGITIRDRLRVLNPGDPSNSYEYFDLVPSDLMDAVRKARIVITNYHAFMLREKEQVSKLNRQILGGREGEKHFTETEGEMIARVAPELMGRKNIIVLNDEAHHCYRRKVGGEEEEDLKGEDREEAEKNEKAARVWINGIEAFERKLGVDAIYDLSATPFFLRGSGYPEGTLFPWVVSDFGLLDAIESGIVKVPRLPVLDDAIQGELPKFRDIYNVIRKDNPRALPAKGRGKQAKSAMDPQNLPHLLGPGHRSALQSLRDSLQSLGERAGARPAAGLHRRLQQHGDLQARLRLDIRLRDHRGRGRQEADARGEGRAAPVLQCRREWSLAAALPHSADRQRAT